MIFIHTSELDEVDDDVKNKYFLIRNQVIHIRNWFDKLDQYEQKSLESNTIREFNKLSHCITQCNN